LVHLEPRARLGLARPSERGIDVINLSLSSPDASDGQDLASQLAAKAVQLGVVVVASMGNDGLAGHVPSPAAGDGVIAVGAWNDARTPEPGDDSWPAFNNTGRAPPTATAMRPTS
jgi:subtilisin family serine protease